MAADAAAMAADKLMHDVAVAAADADLAYGSARATLGIGRPSSLDVPCLAVMRRHARNLADSLDRLQAATAAILKRGVSL